LGKLSEILTEKQRFNKIGNLISHMRVSGKIKNTGSKKNPSPSSSKNSDFEAKA
jgi:hypothetical protein